MLRLGDRKRFEESIIAQHDDEDYSESGYVVVRIGDWCAIGSYGHCSCYDTWASLTGGGISDSEGSDDPGWDWTGTWNELVELAQGGTDPRIAGRRAVPEDADYDHLMEVYKQVIQKVEDDARTKTNYL